MTPTPTPTPKPKPSNALADAVKADNARRARAVLHPRPAPRQAAKQAPPAPAAAPRIVGMADLFPEQGADAIAAAVAAWWDTAAALPVPRAPIVCPVCAGAAFPRAWQVYRLPEPSLRAHTHRLPWRCDVSMKCHTCSAVWPHGIAITEAQARQYGANPTTLEAAAYTWRQARDRLAGYLKG